MAAKAELKREVGHTSARLTDTSAIRSEPLTSSAFPRLLAGKLDLLVLGALLLIAFWPILTDMWGSWFDDRAYMEHGVLVIPAAAYMAWTKRDKLRTLPRRPSIWGAFLLLAGAMQAIFGLAAQWVWFSRVAFLISLVGYLAALFG
jgi:hypothetical protein